MSSGGVDEVDACIVACDVDVAMMVSFETTSEGREKGERARKCVDEVRDESVRGERWGGEETTLLDVVREEHVKV